MTRKKSNVKALALAVTCAILAGGGIGLKPVYAADALYKDNTTGNVTITSSTSATEITGITVGGVTLQDKGITAADGNFTVDGDDGKIVVTGGNGTVTIDPSGEGIVYERKDAGQRIQLDSGYVKASGYVEAPKFSIDGDNFFKKEGNESQLLVSDTKGRVNIGSGTITATGDVNVGGNLWVGGTSRFIDGIETDTIDEATTGAGVTVDGVLLKDKGISAADDKFTVNGATGNVTTTGNIQGNNITATGALKGKTLGIGGVANDQFTVDENGAVKAAGGKFTVDADGNTTVGGTLGVTGATILGSTLDVTGKTTLKDELQVDKKATFGSAAGSQTIINGGDITADGQLNAKSARIGGVNGIGISDSGVITGVTKLTTKALEVTDNLVVGGDITGASLKGTSLAIAGNGTIGGSLGVTGAITSTKATGDTGVLDGSNLTLTNGANKTKLNAGGATFTKDGKTTTISGDEITTKTLNVDVINLGEGIYDTNGTSVGGNLSMDKQGNFKAAGGNFIVKGGNGDDKGAFTNKVGNTTLKTDTTGANMSFEKDGVTSNVSVGANNAKVSAGAGSIDVTNESITSKVGEKASSTIKANEIVDKVGDYSVTTNDKGTTFAKKGDDKTTNINGGTITTGKLITDELVITGNGAAGGTDTGTGSIAFGGNGTIKSDIKDGDKNTNFTTDINGVTTKVTDGTTTTANSVTAAGNTNTVTKDDTHKSEFNQGLTSIGGVVTNGEIKVAQKLNGETGKLTSEVKDANGSSKLEQSGTGLTYTDSAKPDNATRINSSDVSIGSAKNEKDRINLSDLGQIDDLDSELTARGEYNQTAVGGINAEAAIRREEVARLDNRIDDVSNRVDKVGAMAAAIASLKSIGYNPQAPSQFSIALGQYKGETGVAMGFFHYPNKNFMINVNLSTAGGETMGGIGATWCFGHKSPQKLLEEQREAQVKKELAAAKHFGE